MTLPQIDSVPTSAPAAVPQPASGGDVGVRISEAPVEEGGDFVGVRFGPSLLLRALGIDTTLTINFDDTEGDE